jgi:hypothetical protein
VSDGFLSRWSRRKEAVREGKSVEPEPTTAKPGEPPAPKAAPVPAELPSSGSDPALAQPAPPPPPTLEDVESLTPASDFGRFMQPGVTPEVKNAAMKKLFADPHFNVMDRLDTYIDDYNTPDPIPPAMLRQLASAKFLGLFDKEEREEAEAARIAAGGREVADDPTPQTVAQSGTAGSSEAVHPPAEDHADPDLRLQQDDAPGRREPGAGSG